MKKVLIGILAFCLMLSSVACGGASPKVSNPETSTSTATADTKAEVSNVKVQCIGGGLTQDAYDKSKAANPNDVGVLITDAVKKAGLNVDFQDWGWAEDLDQKQRAAILSGNAPDIVHGEVFMPTYAATDVLLPLPKDIVDTVDPNYVLKNKKGEPVAVANTGTIFLLYYNKDLLKNAGVDPETPIKTWDDWKKISDTVTSKGAEKVFGGGIPSHPHAGGALRAAGFIRMLGADFMSNDGKATINTPEMKQALQYIRDMDKNLPKGVGNNPDEGPLYKMFGQDKTLAFVVNGTWQAGELKKNKMNYGVTALPIPANGKASNCRVGYNYYGVTATSKNPDAAFNVLRIMVSKEVLEPVMKDTLSPVCNKEVLSNADIVNSDPSLKAAVESLKAGEVQGLPAFSKNDSQIWNIIDTKVLARTTMTNDPIEKIIADAQTEIDALQK